jgi:hypothetical protein
MLIVDLLPGYITPAGLDLSNFIYLLTYHYNHEPNKIISSLINYSHCCNDVCSFGIAPKPRKIEPGLVASYQREVPGPIAR